MDKRERHLSLAEVVARGLPDDRGVVEVEDVVAELEAAAEEQREFGEGLLRRLVGVDGETAHPRTGHEERGGLVVDHLIIVFLGEGMLACEEELFDFAEREAPAKVAEGIDYADVARGYGPLHGRRGVEVADEHGHVVVPHGVDRGVSAAHLRVVDDVVVDERGVVEKLYGSRGVDDALVDRASGEARAENQHKRPDLLPFRAQVLLHDPRHQLRRASEAVMDASVEALQIGATSLLYCS